MVKRCPHCQTRPLQLAAEACWYCGKDYRVQPRLRKPMEVQEKIRVDRPPPSPRAASQFEQR
jgi:hypothetical protein